MSSSEQNMIEDRGMQQINSATSGALRGALGQMGNNGLSGGPGNAMTMDIARGVGSQVRGLNSDIAAQNMAYKNNAQSQYGGALNSARDSGLRVSEGNAKLTRADLAARIGATGTGIGLLEQSRGEGRYDKAHKEDLAYQKQLEQMKLDYAKSFGAL